MTKLTPKFTTCMLRNVLKKFVKETCLQNPSKRAPTLRNKDF